MSNVYERLKRLCDEHGITGYKMCKDTGMQPSIMTDLKMGRKQTLSAKSMAKVAKYFNVPINYIAEDVDDYDKFNNYIPSYLVESGLGNEYEGDTMNKNNSLNVTAEEMSELAEVWNTFHERAEMKMLFKSANTATPEQLIEVAKYLEYLKSKE